MTEGAARFVRTNRSRAIPTPWRIGLAAIVGGVMCAVLAPLVYVVFAVFGNIEGSLETLFRADVWRLVWRTVLLALCVTASALALATGLAWVIARRPVPGGRAWLIPLSLPLAAPSFLVAEAHHRALGFDGFVGAWLSITLITYPLALLPLEATLRRVSRDAEHAARCFGCTGWQAFRKATLPQIMPTLEWTGLLIALYALSDYGAPAMLRIQVLTTAIESRRMFDPAGVAVLSLLLCAMAMACIVGIGRIRSTRWWIAPSAHVEIRCDECTRLRGAGAVMGTLLCAGTFAMGVGVPASMVLLWWIKAGEAADTSMLGALRIAGPGASRSLGVAIATTAIACVLAVPFLMLGLRSPDAQRGSRTTRLSTLTLVGYAMPGVVVGFALVSIGLRTPLLYQTLPLLLMGYLVRSMAETLGPASAAARRLPHERLDAARGLGASYATTWRRIGLPAVAPGLIAGGALTFLTVVKELPVTLILRPTGFDTLAFELFDSLKEAMHTRAAPMAVVLLLVSGLVVGALVASDKDD
ncbi:MAG: iron ABC transporter permease [Phycisphaerales bacterium]|nr:MAG: iron ABC transporter permease [Phycisphaerales bacterium]